jgi:hypothetical protein
VQPNTSVSVVYSARLAPLRLQQNGEITDAAGHFWRVHDLRAMTVLIING